MSASFFEIVQLKDGDYALRRIDDDESAPLVRISFSTEAKDMIDDKQLMVAKAMIAAGIEAVGNVAHDIDWDEDDAERSESSRSHTLH
ncbi:hypothetical protein [Marinobacter salicampi]|uniref:hypothetical protein n=1 Tax=Marinobacter salicampi TaxID=435907 RepID=UPI00140C582F|nr:hypothetical protein [Marinobacter salicampi]